MMNDWHAVRTVENMRRYGVTRGGKSMWNTKGRYVPQHMIRMCTKAQRRKAERIMEPKIKMDRFASIRVDRLLSWQGHLEFHNLMWNVKNVRQMQQVDRRFKDTNDRGFKLPTLVHIGRGWYVVWNGNHRCTANIIRGATHVLAHCFRER